MTRIMSRNIRYFIFAFLITALILPPLSAQGEEYRMTHVNPIYSHVIQEPVAETEDQNPLSAFFSAIRRQAGGPFSCYSFEELKTELTDQLGLRETEIIITYEDDFLFSEVETILINAFNDIFAADDYLRFSYRQWAASWSGYNGSVTITITMEYWTTYANEVYVDDAVTQVLGEIITSDMNNEEIALAIHDWIMDHVTYDGTYTYYSAYAALSLGTAVCQGYSLLYYKMLEDAGLDARIVDSTAMNHAWNMVNLCDDWYHTDVTWNDGTASHDYYNRSDSEFGVTHTWENPDNYPDASTSYSLGVCQLQPTADAGPDQTVNQGEAVALDGTNSSNLPNVSPLTYAWTQTAGPTATLSDTASSQPTFTAPDVTSGDVSLTFRLTVTNSDALTHDDTVVISIAWDSASPIANAGSNQILTSGNDILLDAGLSTDEDGTIVSYAWELVHRESTGYNTTAEGETVTITGGLYPGIYDVTLTVTDNDGLTDTDAIVIEVVETANCFISSLNIPRIFLGRVF